MKNLKPRTILRRVFVLLSFVLQAVLVAYAFSTHVSDSLSAEPVATPRANSAQDPVVLIAIDGTINPGTDDYLKTSIAHAQELGAKLVVLRLNTPGGLLTSMQSMVERLLDSPIPTVVYVSPSGASATSAGVFITLAGHVAAMAPGTTIGAAHPVNSDGQDVDGDMRAKVENSMVSLVKAISQQRNRNEKWAEKAVRESVSITDRDAVKEKVVDLVSSDLEKLLSDLEGRTVTVQGKPVVLTGLASAPQRTFEMSFKQKVVNVLSDPNIAILLGLGAMVGLGIELYHPGVVLPGIVGVVCLVLSLTAGQVLPINYGGAALLLLGLLFFVIESFVPSFGVWGISGIVCFVIGSIYFIDTDQVWSLEGMHVDPTFVGAVAAAAAIVLSVIGTFAMSSRRRRAVTGKEGLVGEIGVVKSDFKPADNGFFEGKAHIRGAYWTACSQSLLHAGEKVKVESVEAGMNVVVKKVA